MPHTSEHFCFAGHDILQPHFSNSWRKCLHDIIISST